MTAVRTLPSTGRADLVVLGGRGFSSGDPRQISDGRATAIAVHEGHISALGTDRDVTALADDRTTVVDARGGLIMPGFNDAHLHLRMGAISLDRLDLYGLPDLDDIQRAVFDYARARHDTAWIVGRGWLYAAFSGGMPTREQLDAVVPDRPAYFECFDGHSGWANSRALEIAGISAETADPPNGMIVRDAEGRPTGALKERATELVEKILPQPSAAELEQLVLQALQALRRAGITAVQDAWAGPDDWHLLAGLCEREGRLPVRVRLAVEMLPGDDAGALTDKLDELCTPVAGDTAPAWLRTGILKSFADGVVEARTAAMLEPYAGTSELGDLRWPDADLRAAVAQAHARGWQVEIHAIGTRAVRQALDAYEALGPGQAASRRHRIEHIETIEPADLPRFAQLGVVASMQPLHAVPDMGQIDLWSSNLISRVAQSGWRLRSLLESGAALAIGSDWPVVPFNPLHSIYAAVKRQTVDGWPAGGWLADEGLGLRQALAAATYGSAYAEHAEHERGSLAVGKAADLILLDRDVLAEGTDAILDTHVALTMVDGVPAEP